MCQSFRVVPSDAHNFLDVAVLNLHFYFFPALSSPVFVSNDLSALNSIILKDICVGDLVGMPFFLLYPSI